MVSKLPLKLHSIPLVITQCGYISDRDQISTKNEIRVIINDVGRVASAACRKRLRYWATVFCFTLSFINPSSAIGTKQNGL